MIPISIPQSRLPEEFTALADAFANAQHSEFNLVLSAGVVRGDEVYESEEAMAIEGIKRDAQTFLDVIAPLMPGADLPTPEALGSDYLARVLEAL